MRRWFLSYNSADVALVEGLDARLRAAGPGEHVFFAPKSLRAGGYWLPKLADEIRDADAFVLLIGGNGVGPWQVIEYYEALDRRVKEPGFPLIVLLVAGCAAPGLPFLRQLHWIVTADPASAETLGRLRAAAGGAEGRPHELWRHTAPYRSMTAMTEADSDFFFGRTPETVAVLSAMADASNRLAVLVGNSGVGKSSLAQAGVLAALKRQAWPDGAPDAAWPHAFADSRRWCFLKLQPGSDPLKALVEPFLRDWRYETTDPMREERQSGWIDALLKERATLSGLLDATEARYEELGNPQTPGFILYVDQGEELYVRADEQRRRRFSEILAEGLADPRLTALMSVRADFFGALQNDAPLFAVHHLVNVPALRRPQLSEVIARPAELLSARFENPTISGYLARRTEEESVKEAGALPLLSYLLHDMWKEMVTRGDGVLRLPAAAIELGGVLVERANMLLVSRPKAEDQLRRLLTLKLATVREDVEPTRRRALRSEFSEEEWRLVSELADLRLLVTVSPEGGETYAEVAHEAIFTRWDRLRDWIAAEREFLTWRSSLEGDRRKWEKSAGAERDDALLMGLDLAQAQSWLARRPEDIARTNRDYIEASIRRELGERAQREKDRAQRERLQRRLLQGAIVALAIVTGLAGFSIYEAVDANQQRVLAQQGRREADAQRREAEEQAKRAEAQKQMAVAAQTEAENQKQVAERQRTLAEAMRKDAEEEKKQADEQRLEAEKQKRAAEAATTEAERQKQRAEKNFTAAKQAVDNLIFDVVGGLRHVAGMRVETIRKILDTVRGAVDQLAEAAPDDPGLQQSRGAMFISFVDTYLAAGDVKDARDAADAAVNANRKLAAQDPGNARAQRDVSVSVSKLGNVKLQTGDQTGALAAYQEDLDIARKLAQDPGSARAQRDVSVSLEKLGDVKRQAGDQAGALAAYRESLDIRRKLAAQDPGNAQAQRDFSVSLNRLGDIRLRAGERAGALAAYQESLDIRRRLAAQDLGNAQAQTDVVVSLTKLADIADEPVPLYREALAILQKLDQQRRLSAEQKGWIGIVNDKLAAPPSGAAESRRNE